MTGSVPPTAPTPRGGKRRGAGPRPRVKGERTQPVGARMTAAEVAAVDAYAEAHGVKRAEAVRRLVALGLVAAGRNG